MMKSAEYDPKNKRLRIKFKSGIAYVYKSVPADVYEQLIVSESAGIFFHENIKDKYKFEQEDE